MKRLLLFFCLALVFAVSRFLDPFPDVKNIVALAAIFFTFFVYILRKIFSGRSNVKTGDFILGIPIIILLLMISLKQIEVIYIGDVLMWIIFAAFAIICLGYYYYLGERES